MLALLSAAIAASPFQVSAAQQGNEVLLTIDVPAGAMVYRDATTLTVTEQGVDAGEPVFPLALPEEDPATGGSREAWTSDVLIKVPVQGGPGELGMELHYQGCANRICTLPLTESIRVPVALVALVGDAHAGEAKAEEPEVKVTVAVDGDDILVDFKQSPGWHVNKTMTSVDPPLVEEGQASPPWRFCKQTWPAAHARPDPAVPGATRPEFDGDFQVRVDVAGPAGAHTVKGTVMFQACKAELCKMPQYVDFELPVTLDGSNAAPTDEACAWTVEEKPDEPTAAAHEPAAPEVAAAPAPAAGGLDKQFSEAREKGLGFLFVLVFLAGLGVSLTPCVLPMVPITLGIIGAETSGSRLKGLSLAATYVAGQAAIYTVLGVTAALTGSIFGAWMQNPWVVGGVALFFVAMGASMFGWFEVAVPSSIATRLAERGGAGYAGALVVGAVGAIVAGPCSGPVIASLMVLIGQQQEVALGAALMLDFSLGMGMIFLVAGLVSGDVLRPGAWMDTVKKSFGVLMWLGAIYFMQAHLPTWAVALSTAGVLLGTGVFSWPSAQDAEMDGPNITGAKRVYGVAAVLVGAYLLLGTLVSEGFILPPLRLSSAAAGAGAAEAHVNWRKDPEAAFAEAKAGGKPMIIDFTADWCAACKELEHFTYTDPEVIKLSEGFVPLMVDATKADDPVAQPLIEKYSVNGLPTVLFIKADGTVVESLRLTGFEPAPEFLNRMRSTLGS